METFPFTMKIKFNNIMKNGFQSLSTLDFKEFDNLLLTITKSPNVYRN